MDTFKSESLLKISEEYKPDSTDFEIRITYGLSYLGHENPNPYLLHGFPVQ